MPNIELPVDTVAKVSSESLLGGKYVALEPGAEDDMIKPGGQIQFTQASLNIEEMIGKFIFSAADDKKGQEKKEEGAASADPYAAAE